MNVTNDNELMHFDDELLRYMRGEMSGDEEADFMALLAADEPLRQKAIATARLAKAMRDVGTARDRDVITAMAAASPAEVRAVAEKACGTVSKKARLRLKRILPVAAAAASVLLCAVGGYNYYEHRQTVALGEEYMACFSSATEITRGEADTVSVQLDALYAKMANKSDLSATIATLEAMWAQSRTDTYSAYTAHMPQIGWMLASAYLCDGDRQKALEVLDQLIAASPADTAVGAKARELKKKIAQL